MPVIVSARFPTRVLELVEMVSVVLLPVVELGVNDALALLGRPLTEKDTAALKPFARLTVIS